MTTTLDLDPVKEAALVASQNDAFRRSILGNILVTDAPQGQFVMTRGVAALGPDAQLALTRSVASFDAFNADSDPQGWHEMGVIDPTARRSGSRSTCTTSTTPMARLSPPILIRRAGS